MQKKWSRGSGTRALVDALRTEIEELREENARLRLEAQRPAGPGLAAARIGEIGARVAFTDEGDEAWESLTEASVLRDALLRVCRELATCALQVERQLTTLLPPTELDRRVRDRRRVPNHPQAPGSVEGTAAVGLEEAS